MLSLAAILGAAAGRLFNPEAWVMIIAVFSIALSHPRVIVPLGIGSAYIAYVVMISWHWWELSGTLHNLPFKLTMITSSVMLLAFMAYGLALLVRKIRAGRDRAAARAPSGDTGSDRG